MSKYAGYMGRVAQLDLTTGKVSDYPWSDRERELYMGGKIMQMRGILSTKNYNYGQYEEFEKVSGEVLAEEHNLVNKGCLSCPIKCARSVLVDGKEVKGPELETLGLLGGGILNDDLARILRWNNELDELGLDTISAASTLAWAMDVCRSVLRLGARDTCVLYRRSRDEMPAAADEMEEAEKEGVRFRFLAAPVEFLGEEGKVKVVRVELMELGEPDEKGRRKPVGTGKYETIEVDSVIGAIGQTVDWGALDTGALVKTKKGTAEADGFTYQTAQPDIFVGGDVYTGPKFAIDAIAAGKEAAVSLHRFVHPGQSLTTGRDRREYRALDKDSALIPVSGFDNDSRQAPGYNAAKARSFGDARVTFTEEQVRRETARCLGCGATKVDAYLCIGCGLCTTKCRFDAIHLKKTRDWEAGKFETMNFLICGTSDGSAMASCLILSVMRISSLIFSRIPGSLIEA